MGSPSRSDLQQRVVALQADGGTGIYDAVLAAYAESAGGDYILSIVLMTDGELTAGRTYDQFQCLSSFTVKPMLPIWNNSQQQPAVKPLTPSTVT